MAYAHCSPRGRSRIADPRDRLGRPCIRRRARPSASARARDDAGSADVPGTHRHADADDDAGFGVALTVSEPVSLEPA